MFFYWFEPRFKLYEVHNEAWRMAWWWRTLLFAGCGVGGLLYAAALPPLNWSPAAFVTLIPVLVFVSLERRWRWRFAAGWFWGWCHAVCAYSFLREIEWFTPWLLAPVMGLFPAVWAMLVAATIRPVVFPLTVDASGIDDRRAYLEKGAGLGRLLILGVTAAALFTAIEFSRSRLFVWNDLAVTQYRNRNLIQLAALTGSYGVGFCIALVNSALYLSFFRRGWRATLILICAAAAMTGGGFLYSRMLDAETSVSRSEIWRVLAIQGDLSQRRHATSAQVDEALDVYGKLSLEALDAHPSADVAVWPESAVPIPYYSMLDLANRRLKGEGRLYRRYQETVRNIALYRGKPLIFGALDVEEDAFMRKKASPGMTNSALMMGGNGVLCARYDKFHRVPYGEYVPGRGLLPGRWVAAMDMGRDLTPGDRLEPWSIFLKRNGGGESFAVRPGIVICYEGVFGYVTRTHVRHGANVLLALSNDAWYPRSSEPEQHLANATLRAVECGVPMIRVGNNGGTGLLTRRGEFTQILTVPGDEARPELRRGRGYRLLEVGVVADPHRTLAVRWGDWFPWLLTVWCVVVSAFSVLRRQALLENGLEKNEDPMGGAEGGKGGK